jgi:hypothetical protein
MSMKNQTFKLKLVKKSEVPWPEPKKKMGQGLYQQLKGQPVRSDPKEFSLDLLKDTFADLFANQPKERTIKIHTNQAGMDLFNKAVMEQATKATKNIKNEYRKRFSFQSEIFKQTYKFG